MFATTLLFNKYIKCFAESHFLPDERVLKIVKIARQNCNITTLGGGGWPDGGGGQIRSWLLVIITNVLRALQRKLDKLEISKLFYFVHRMLMKNGIEYFSIAFTVPLLRIS